MSNKIKVVTVVPASIGQIWKIWNDPKHIINWNSAHPDWHTPNATTAYCPWIKSHFNREAKL